MLTQRQAAALLQDPAGPTLTRRLAHEVLAAGFAGLPVDIGSVRLYDDAAVQRLAGLPDASGVALPAACRTGFIVVRTAARPGVALLPSQQRLHAVSGPFRMSPWTRLELDLLLRTQGFVPTVVTVASFVLVTAALTGLTADSATPATRGRLTNLVLRHLGGSRVPTWADAFTERRLRTPPGSPLLFWTPRLQPFPMTTGQPDAVSSHLVG